MKQYLEFITALIIAGSVIFILSQFKSCQEMNTCLNKHKPSECYSRIK